MNETNENSKPKKKRGRKVGKTGPPMDRNTYGGYARLNEDEEQKLNQLTDAELEQEIRKYLCRIENVTIFSSGSLYGQELRRFKSLIHIYSSHPEVSKRLEMNVRILMAISDISSVAALSKAITVHPSHIWRLLKGSGWTWGVALVPMCLAFKVKPSVLLFEDLHQWVKWAARLEEGLEQPERKSI